MQFCHFMRPIIFLMSLLASAVPVAAQFGEAKWIGADEDHLPLYSNDLAAFRIDFDFQVVPGSRVALIYGKDDPRLMSAHANLFNTCAAPGESYMKITVDGAGTVNIYRVGYRPDDNADVPVATFSAATVMKPETNHLQLSTCLGNTEVIVNGVSIGKKGVGAAGNGPEAIAYPVLGSMAVEIDSPGNMISSLSVSNFRDPFNELFSTATTFDKTAMVNVPQRSMPQLRGAFTADPAKNVEKATVTATARGIYDMKVNGRRVTDDYFYPGATQYNKTHLYHSFDITPLVKPGENNVDVQLAEGWWSGPATYGGESWNFYGDRQSFLANIEIEYSDGTTASFPTSPSTWMCSTDGPVKTGSFFQGEIYDATVDENVREWNQAVEIPLEATACGLISPWNEAALRPTFGDRVSAVDTVSAISVTEPRPGVYVYDIGQNMAGVPCIDFSGLPRGTEATICFAEVLYPDMPQYDGHQGMLMTENLRAAMCRDKYIVAGVLNEIFSPRTTFHGYRYIEISGLPAPLPIEKVKSVALSSIRDFRAGFECSSPLVNRLWQNVQWSSRANFLSIPTDCPQRNERLGWMGDISVFSPTATKIADVDALLAQFLQSVRDLQKENGKYPDVAPTGYGFGGLLWGSAGITVPYHHFSQYADTAVIREHYPSMKRYIDYLFAETMDPASGIMVQDRAWSDLADWLSPEYDRTDKSLLWECYLIHDLDIVAQIAGVLGEEEDAVRYAELASRRRELFNRVYVDPETRKTRFSAFVPDKEGREVDTQASYALPIAMDIVADSLFCENFFAAVARENVADDGRVCPPHSLMTGFIGTAWISEALSKAGRADLAYRMLNNTQYPSWLYPVTQGATSVWERLNSYTVEDGFGGNNGMNSFNHYSFGAVGNWLLTRAGGISNGFGELVFRPQPDPTGEITWVNVWADTQAGRATCSWKADADGTTVEISSPCDAVYIDPATGEKHPVAVGNHTFRTAKAF